MNEIPFPLLVVLVILAVIAGLVVGARAGRSKALDRSKGAPSTAQRLGRQARQLTTSGIVRLWKWNRARTKNKPDSKREADETD